MDFHPTETRAPPNELRPRMSRPIHVIFVVGVSTSQLFPSLDLRGARGNRTARDFLEDCGTESRPHAVHLADDVEGEILGHGGILLSRCIEGPNPGTPSCRGSFASLRMTRAARQFSTIRVPGGPVIRKSAAGRALPWRQPSNRNSVRLPAESWYDSVRTLPSVATKANPRELGSRTRAQQRRVSGTGPPDPLICTCPRGPGRSMETSAAALFPPLKPSHGELPVRGKDRLRRP